MPRLGIDTAIHLGIELGIDLATAAPIAPTLPPAPPTLAEIMAAYDLTVQVGGVDQRTSLFTGDLYNVDGVTTKVGAIVDHYDPTHLLEQAVSGAQVAVPAADAVLNGAQALTFNALQHYTSNRPASAWRHQHSGIGFSCMVWTSTLTGIRCLWATINIAATAGNTGTYVTTSPTAFTFRSYNAGAITINVSSIAVTYPVGSACTTAVSVLDGAAQEVQTRSDGAQVSSVSASVLTAADPASPLRFGAHLDGTLPFQGRLGFLLFAPFRPTPAQITLLNQYLLPKYGVTV